MGDQIAVIEIETIRAEYNMRKTLAIVVHPVLGRLYIAQQYGGEQTLDRGAIRWSQGLACQLQPSDTLQSLRDAMHNNSVTVYDAMLSGYDSNRPVLQIGGKEVEQIARAAGLTN